tara:strand:+ start:175 stop:1467 length:1293 start_codon:yes stop_codon:yes gene_type:complete
MTVDTKVYKKDSLSFWLTKAYPQLIGEVELLLENNPEWLSILEEPLQDNSDISHTALDLLETLGFSSDEAVGVYGELQGMKAGKKKKLIVSASEIEEKKINWIVPEVLAEGQVHLVAGDPSVSKSLFTTDLSARISTGAETFGYPLPEHYQYGHSVLIFSAEDDSSRVIKPRLRNAKANMENIYLLNSSEFPELPDDISQFAKAMAIVKPKVMIIDTINAFMGGKIDSNNDKSVRSAIKLLKPLAEYYQCAIVLVTHLNKGKSTNPQYRILGSIAYTGFCRSVWLIAKNEETEERIVSVIKNNNGSMPSFKYEIQVVNDYPVINFLGKTDERAEDIGIDEISRGEVQSCADDIMNILEERSEKIESSALITRLSSMGYSKSCVERARAYLKKENLATTKKIGNKWYVASQDVEVLEGVEGLEQKGGENDR